MLKKIKICLILLPLFANILQAQSNHTKQLFVTAGGQFGYGETRIGSEEPKIIPQWNYYGGINVDVNYRILGIQAKAFLERRSTLNKDNGEPGLNINLDYASVEIAGKFNAYNFYGTIGHYYSNIYKNANVQNSINTRFIDSIVTATDHGLTMSIGYNFFKNEHLFICLEGNYKQGWVQIFGPTPSATTSHAGPSNPIYQNGINTLLGFSIVVKQRIFYKTFKQKRNELCYRVVG